MTGRALDRSTARAFYDRFGAKQDRQGWYEDAAVERLIDAARFDTATAVLELGCGTGRQAERLLRDVLPAGSCYLGVEISSAMAALSRERLAPFGARAKVLLEEGDGRPALGARTFDRFLSTYVLDLLSEAEVAAVLAWAWQTLSPDGLLAIAGITNGRGALSKLAMAAWSAVFRLAPLRVGGCRPMQIAERLDPRRWRVEVADVVVRWGVASEVLVARRQAAKPTR